MNKSEAVDISPLSSKTMRSFVQQSSHTVCMLRYASRKIALFWRNLAKCKQTLVLVASFMLLISSSHAQIYKWTDSQGVVHFSDSPHAGSKQVTVPEAQSFSPPVSQTNSTPQEPEKTMNEEHKYSKISIMQPLNEATIRNNQGYVVVAVELEPALAEGDMLQMVFDGAPLGDPQPNTLFQLNGIYRGSHTLAVQILNAAGEVLLTSDNITIFMHRPHVNMGRGTKPVTNNPNAGK